MKYLILAFLVCLVSCQKQEITTTLPTDVTTGAAAVEDCDTKAAEKVEIKDEGISLSGGDTGCTLDDAQK
jgi:hypothetical protein